MNPEPTQIVVTVDTTGATVLEDAPVTRDQTVSHDQEHLFNAPSTMPGQLTLPGAN